MPSVAREVSAELGVLVGQIEARIPDTNGYAWTALAGVDGVLVGVSASFQMQ